MSEFHSSFELNGQNFLSIAIIFQLVVRVSFKIANTRANGEKKIKDYPTVDDFVVHRFSSGTGLKASQKICSGQRGKTHKNSGNDVTSFASLMPLSKQISSFFPPLCSVFSFPCTLFSHEKKERKIEGGGERWESTVKSDEYNEIEREFELIKYLENMWIKSFFFYRRIYDEVLYVLFNRIILFCTINFILFNIYPFKFIS